jgi:ATP-dependent DNA ligase
VNYIRAAHPTSSISPKADAITRIMASGWVAQAKVNGRRAQIHVSPDGKLKAYTRQGTLHTMALPLDTKQALVELLRSDAGDRVADAEWHTQTGRVFLFDLLADKGEVLSGLTYSQRNALLPLRTEGPVDVLPYLTLCDAVAMASGAFDAKFIEGIVLKSPSSRGFADTTVIRCRCSGAVYTGVSPRLMSLISDRRALEIVK